MDALTVSVIHRAGRHAADIREAIATHAMEVDVDFRFLPDPTPDDLAESEIILTFDLDTTEAAAAKRLEWVQALNAGVDRYPVEDLAERGVRVTNSSGVHAEPIAEQVLGYLLVFERRIHEGMRQQREGEWTEYVPGEIHDRTLGIVGVGAIGTRVAELADSIGMDVIGVKRDPATAPETLVDCRHPDDLAWLLDQSDYVALACPLTDATHHLIGSAELSRLSPEAVLVNIARGSIVDESALISALESGEIRGAALDVFEEEPLPADSPLREMDEVIMTPHVAGETPHYFDRAMDIFVENIRRYSRGEELANQIV